MNNSAIIIGSGIAGMSVAYALSLRNFHIYIIDKNKTLAMGASGNQRSIIMPSFGSKMDKLTQLYCLGFDYTKNLIKNFTKYNIAHDFCGVVDFSNDKLKRYLNKSSKDLLDDENYFHNIALIKLEQLKDILGLNLSGQALYYQNSGWVSLPDICQAIAHNITPRCNFLFKKEAKTIKFFDGNWSVYDAKNAPIARAKNLIIASAVDYKEFPQISWLEINKVRGQINFVPEFCNLKTVICAQKSYILPSLSRMHIIGATFDRNDNNDNLSLKSQNNLLNDIKKYLPKDCLPPIFSELLNGRVSYRAMSVDRIPYIGAVPDLEWFYQYYKNWQKYLRSKEKLINYLPNFYVSLGHGARGAITAPIAGEHIARLICGEPNNILNKDIDNEISPLRLALRNLRKRQ